MIGGRCQASVIRAAHGAEQMTVCKLQKCNGRHGVVPRTTIPLRCKSTIVHLQAGAPMLLRCGYSNALAVAIALHATA
eukprot:scaffold72142_cov22-Tisochrysis_lutea.AAC.1